jgi:VWFA-related protein
MGMMYFTQTDWSRERKHEVMNSRVTLQKILRRALPLLILFAILLTSARVSRAQAPSGAAGQDNPPGEKARGNPSETQIHNDKNEAKQEVSMQDTATTFKLRVNLVQVRVVVRDSKGKPVEGLKREDFQVYDQGKLQAITAFEVETPKSRQELAEAAVKTRQAAGEEAGGEKVTLPERFVALVFDDIHLTMGDASVVRASAKALIESMAPTDRIGIFTTSEQLKRDFTSDKAALEETLLGVAPHPKAGKLDNVMVCPDVTYYMADQWANKANNEVLEAVMLELARCVPLGMQPASLRQLAQSLLQQELIAGDADNNFTYRVLEEVMRRLAAMPGERIFALASPGFLITTRFPDVMSIIDRANRANIVINTVDARGLYTPDLLGDIASRTSDTNRTTNLKTAYRLQEQLENENVLADFAHGTGGTFFHNSNDLEGGPKRLAAASEVSYTLGISPQSQKMDGEYHALKVTLMKKENYSLQARRGYYAPKKVDDPEEQAKQEIAEAVYSQDEIHELLLDLQMQYFKTGDAGAHLSVISRIDVKGMHFRKAGGRNLDNLTVATVIFDDNGNYVTGQEKLLKMNLLDSTYEGLNRTGLSMKASFELKPGKYLVRQVVRDSEGAQMAARNGMVVITY